MVSGEFWGKAGLELLVGWRLLPAVVRRAANKQMQKSSKGWGKIVLDWGEEVKCCSGPRSGGYLK